MPHAPHQLFLRTLWREPLVHFLLFGAVLFGFDAYIAAHRDNPRIIEIGAEVDAQARALFRASTGREPGEQDMKILRERWVDNEVLYREGLALQVDQGDPAIRERVIFKALNVMQANLVLPAIDDAGLRAWFEQHRGNYDEPARFDFQEAVLVADVAPENARQHINEFIAALNGGKPPDAQGGLRVFKARPHANLLASYGKPFTDALEKMPLGQWRALDSKEGLRIIRLDGVTPGATMTYDAIRDQVLADWKDLTMQDLRTKAVRELGMKYTVKLAETVK